jgi:hypothetical protein
LNKERYSDQLVIDYLLGSLAEEEAERLDELSLTDDEFAARLQSVENDLVDAFARGELRGPRLERFNSFYLSSPARREKVRFASAFQTQTVAVKQPDALADRFVEQSVGSAWHRLGRFLFPARALGWGLAAAALLLVAGGGWLVFENLRLQREMHQAQTTLDATEQREKQLQARLAGEQASDTEREKEVEDLRERIARLERHQSEPKRSPAPSLPDQLNIVPFALSPQLRGATGIPTISLPPRADYLALELGLESGDYPFYRAELRSLSDNRVVWRSGRLKARVRAEGKALVASLRAGILGPQRYVLAVSGISATGSSEAVASYVFSVARQ